MSKKANNASLLNVSGAYLIAKDAKVKPVTYKDITTGSVSVPENVVGILTEVYTGILDETNASMKIGYNLYELTKGNTPEYLKLGYASIKSLIEDMFDLNPVTGYAWCDTAGAFIVKDDTGYHSIFRTVEDGETYDFTISQLMEMRTPDKKVPDSLWKLCFDKSVIFTNTATKGIRLIKQTLCDMVDRKEIDFTKINGTDTTAPDTAYIDTIIERIKAIRNKAIANNCKPIDAIKMIEAEKAQPAQAQPAQAQPAQAQPAQAQPAQAQPAQAQPAQAQPAQSGNAPEVENAIQQAIENGKIEELVNSDIMPKIHRYLEFAQNHNSNIVKCALVDFLEYALNIVTNTPTETETTETETETTETETTETTETETTETETTETETTETETETKGKGKGKGKGKAK